MATNLDIDQSLLTEAMELGKLPTKKATVNEALREYIQHRRRLEAIKLFGTIEYDEDYDYKQGRRKDRSRVDEE